MEVTFENIVEAYCWLDSYDKSEEGPTGNKVERIPTETETTYQQREEYRKGVISDWDKEESLEDLREDLDEKENIISMERLKRVKVSAKEGKEVIETHYVLIKIKGILLPRDMSLYGGITRIKIRP